MLLLNHLLALDYLGLLVRSSLARWMNEERQPCRTAIRRLHVIGGLTMLCVNLVCLNVFSDENVDELLSIVRAGGVKPGADLVPTTSLVGCT